MFCLFGQVETDVSLPEMEQDIQWTRSTSEQAMYNSLYF